MSVELSAATLLTLTGRLTAAARARTEATPLAQHLTEVLLSAIPVLDGVALYTQDGAEAVREAAAGDLTDLPETHLLPLVSSTPQSVFCAWEGNSGFGALGVHSAAPLPDETRVLVEVAAQIIGQALDNTDLKQHALAQADLLAAEHQQRLLAERLAEVSLILASQNSYSAILDQTLHFVGQLVPESQSIGITLVRGNALQLERLQTTEPIDSATLWTGQEIPIQYLPATTQLLKNPKISVYEFLGPQDKTSLHHIGLSWMNSYAMLPVMLRERLVGIIWLGSEREQCFSQAELNRLEPLTNAAAIALENAHLLQMAEARANRQQQLNEISARLQESNDVTDLLQTALRELGTSLGARVGRVRLNIPDEQPVEIPGSHTQSNNANGKENR